MNTVNIDRDLCTSCGTCFDACFVNVFRWDDAEDPPVVAYPEDCVECNKCEPWRRARSRGPCSR